MREEASAMRQVAKVTLKDLWTNPIYRYPLIISVVMMLSQQFSGINAAIFYSTTIFKDAGLDERGALFSTLGKPWTHWKFEQNLNRFGHFRHGSRQLDHDTRVTGLDRQGGPSNSSSYWTCRNGCHHCGLDTLFITSSTN